MTIKLNDMMNSISIPEGLDERIELGFKKAGIQQISEKAKHLRLFTALAATLAIIISSVIIAGPDRVEAAIKRALQYVPGYNVLIDKEKGDVMALKQPVMYEKGDVFVKITAAYKIGKQFNISVQGNYMLNENFKLMLKDEKGNVISNGGYSKGSGSKLWLGDYYFETDSENEKYSLLIGDLEIPFTLEKTTEVEDFLQVGNHVSCKGIDIAAVKKPTENGLMISLLNQSKEKILEGYPLGKGMLDGIWFPTLNVEKSMYLTDNVGNKIYPVIPLSYNNMLSDIYFDTVDGEGLKLVLPYVKIKYPDAKTKKIKIAVPARGEIRSIDRILTLDKFNISVIDVRHEGDEILINLKCSSPEEELMDSVSIGGISSYSLGLNLDTDFVELRIREKDVGKSFSIYFKSPSSVLLGDWSIDLN